MSYLYQCHTAAHSDYSMRCSRPQAVNLELDLVQCENAEVKIFLD